MTWKKPKPFTACCNLHSNTREHYLWLHEERDRLERKVRRLQAKVRRLGGVTRGRWP